MLMLGHLYSDKVKCDKKKCWVSIDWWKFVWFLSQHKYNTTMHVSVTPAVCWLWEPSPPVTTTVVCTGLAQDTVGGGDTPWESV